MNNSREDNYVEAIRAYMADHGPYVPGRSRAESDERARVPRRDPPPGDQASRRQPQDRRPRLALGVGRKVGESSPDDTPAGINPRGIHATPVLDSWIDGFILSEQGRNNPKTTTIQISVSPRARARGNPTEVWLECLSQRSHPMPNPPRQDPLPLTANQPGEWRCPGCGHHEHQPPNVQAVWHPCPRHGNRPQPLQPNPQTRGTRHDH